MKEYYRAAYMTFISDQNEFEKELVSVFAQFKKDYPYSVYTKYLNDRFTEIIRFYDTADKNFTQEIKFIDNSDSINSLKSCLTAFKGKKVFIDVWATWCGPCKAEFAYKDQLHVQLQKRNIELLYISIDDISKNELWKNMIKHFDLQGTHIRTNKAFESDLRHIYDPGNSSISIPWYILVDEQGNIIKKSAHNPSEMEELVKDLDGK
jgi:thiol-disulfide isomerase/thioredoxin